MTILLFFIKKIKENKARMILSAGMFSLGLFLVCFFITLCYNFSDNVNLMFAEKKSYCLLAANVTDMSDINAITSKRTISKMAIKKTNLLTDKIDSANVNVSVYEMAIEDTDFLADYIIEGNNAVTESSVMIKKDIIDRYSMNASDIIGKKILFSDSTYYNIVAIYDDKDVFLPDCIITCKSHDFIPEAYFVKAANVKAVPELVSEFEKSGFTVRSNINEIKDSIESTSVLSSVIVLFLIFSFVFVIVVFYSIIMNSVRDMYPFIAMIKAIGYKKKECFMLILASSIYVFIFSAVMTGVLYFIGMPCICHVFKAVDVMNIYNISINVLFKTIVIVPLAELTIVFIGMIIVATLSLTKIQKMQVNEILCEVNR